MPKTQSSAPRSVVHATFCTAGLSVIAIHACRAPSTAETLND